MSGNRFDLAAVIRKLLADHGWPSDPQGLGVIARKVAVAIPPEHREAAWIEVLAAYARGLRADHANFELARRERESRAAAAKSPARSPKVERIREAWAPFLDATHPAVPGKALGEYGPRDLLSVAVHFDGLAELAAGRADLCREFAARMEAAGVARVADMPEQDGREMLYLTRELTTGATA